jgi:ssDNA-binding Zn-finger/Zn-ribbon topoisomerase 1
MFHFKNDKEDEKKTPEQCPVCGKIGRVYAREKNTSPIVTYYVCDTCNITWQDPPARSSCSPYNPVNGDDDDTSGGDLFGLTNFKGK